MVVEIVVYWLAIATLYGGSAFSGLTLEVFAAVLLRDVERVTKGVVAGATLVVVGAVLITI